MFVRDLRSLSIAACSGAILLSPIAAHAAPPAPAAAPAKVAPAAPVAAPAKPAPAPAAPELPPGQDIAVTVNDANVTVLDVMMELNRLLPGESYHGRIEPKKQKELTKRALDNAIILELAAQKGRAAGMTVTPAEIDKEFKSRASRSRGEVTLLKTLKTLGVDRAAYEKSIERDLLSTKFLQKDVAKPATCSDAQLKDYYDKNTKRFTQPDSSHLWLLQVRVDPSASKKVWEERKKLATDLRDQIANKHGDFAALAKQYSGHESKAQGGDLGWLHGGTLADDLDKPAALLKVGEVSGLIENIYGFNIMKLVEKRAARQLSYDEIDKAFWKAELEASWTRERREAGEARLRKGAKIQHLDTAVEKCRHARWN